MTSNPDSIRNTKVAAFYDVMGVFYPVVNLFLHRRRKEMMDWIHAQQPAKLLEVGVGPGIHLADYSCEDITVVDVSPKMIERCRARHPRVKCHVMDGEHLAFEDESFDLVALPHVLSVTANPSRIIGEVHRVLRVGGIMVILNYDAADPLLRKAARIWRWPAAWLGCRSDFHLASLPALQAFSQIGHNRSGVLKQFSLTQWKK